MFTRINIYSYYDSMNLNPRFKLHSLYAVFCIVGMTTFVSCLDMETEMNMRKSGEVDVILKYFLDSDIAEFGRGFGADDPWPLLLTEKDFMLQTIRNEGVKLVRYRFRRISDGRDRITVKLHAVSVESLMSFLDWDVKIEGNTDSGSLEIVLPDYSRGLNEETRKILVDLIGESNFVLRIKPPGKPVKIVGGDIQGTTGVFIQSLTDLVFSDELNSWQIAW